MYCNFATYYSFSPQMLPFSLFFWSLTFQCLHEKFHIWVLKKLCSRKFLDPAYVSQGEYHTCKAKKTITNASFFLSTCLNEHVSHTRVHFSFPSILCSYISIKYVFPLMLTHKGRVCLWEALARPKLSFSLFFSRKKNGFHWVNTKDSLSVGCWSLMAEMK